MRPVASFVFNNFDTRSHKLCLFPGHYNTLKIEDFDDAKILHYASPDAINASGYECDQVADDFGFNGITRDQTKYLIEVKPKNGKTRYRDFLNFIKLSGLRVVKMRITDLTPGPNPSHEIFYQEIEVSKSTIGSKAGSDFIQLSSHINPGNYLQNFIEVDLEKQNLLLDETTLAFLDIPADANFQIDFTLAE